MTDIIDDHSLGWPYVERYLALRKAKLIGAVWPGGGGIYWLAPADAVNAHGQIEPISVPKLRDLIDALDPPQIQLPKKPVQSAASGAWFRDRRRA